MKARDLAQKLLQHPEAKVWVQNYEDLGPTYTWQLQRLDFSEEENRFDLLDTEPQRDSTEGTDSSLNEAPHDWLQKNLGYLCRRCGTFVLKKDEAFDSCRA